MFLARSSPFWRSLAEVPEFYAQWRLGICPSLVDEQVRHLEQDELNSLLFTSLVGSHAAYLFIYKMIGSFLTRALVLAFGYAYPAYECYKTVEKNKPEIEQLRFWCQYWILVAISTVFERVGDAFISWVPMYSEAKLAFFIYLWYPKTRGTTYVYDSFFRPYLSKHESAIDCYLLELRTRIEDIAVLCWQRAASYGQTRVFEILQYIASQSTLNPSLPAQPQQPGARAPPAHRPSTPGVPVEPEEAPSPTSSRSSSPEPKEIVEATSPKGDFSTSLPAAIKVTPSEALIQSVPSEHGVDQMEAEAPAIDETTNPPANPPPVETLMEETLHPTRGRLSRARTTPIKKETDSAAP